MNQESEPVEFFGPLLADPSKREREAVRRRKQFDEKSIIAEHIPEYEAEGLQVDRRLKRSIRVKRATLKKSYSILSALENTPTVSNIPML